MALGWSIGISSSKVSSNTFRLLTSRSPTGVFLPCFFFPFIFPSIHPSHARPYHHHHCNNTHIPIPTTKPRHPPNNSNILHPPLLLARADTKRSPTASRTIHQAHGLWALTVRRDLREWGRGAPRDAVRLGGVRRAGTGHRDWRRQRRRGQGGVRCEADGRVGVWGCVVRACGAAAAVWGRGGCE